MWTRRSHPHFIKNADQDKSSTFHKNVGDQDPYVFQIKNADQEKLSIFQKNIDQKKSSTLNQKHGCDAQNHAGGAEFVSQ